jgi:hypothetical protein
MKYHEIESKLRDNYGKTVSNPHYQMGLEVLMDVHCLANCDGLVCGHSGVSIFAMYNSNTLKEYYAYEDLHDSKEESKLTKKMKSDHNRTTGVSEVVKIS